MHSLALLIQQVEQCCGLLADQVDAACVVDVVDIAPADAFCSIFLLQEHKTHRGLSTAAAFSKTSPPSAIITYMYCKLFSECFFSSKKRFLNK